MLVFPRDFHPFFDTFEEVIGREWLSRRHFNLKEGVMGHVCIFSGSNLFFDCSEEFLDEEHHQILKVLNIFCIGEVLLICRCTSMLSTDSFEIFQHKSPRRIAQRIGGRTCLDSNAHFGIDKSVAVCRFFFA